MNVKFIKKGEKFCIVKNYPLHLPYTNKKLFEKLILFLSSPWHLNPHQQNLQIVRSEVSYHFYEIARPHSRSKDLYFSRAILLNYMAQYLEKQSNFISESKDSLSYKFKNFVKRLFLSCSWPDTICFRILFLKST